MENQHRKIKGYRELNQEEIDLMNKIKEKGVELEELISSLRIICGLTYDDNDPYKNADMTNDEILARQESARWISIGQTHLQQGLMSLTRAVAKPNFF